jgi:hypothetical protein
VVLESFRNWLSPTYSRNVPPYMEPEGALPCSQQPAIGLCLGQLNPANTLTSYKIQFNITLKSTHSFPKGPFIFRLSNKNVIHLFCLSVSDVYPGHLILLDLVSPITSGEETIIVKVIGVIFFICHFLMFGPSQLFVLKMKDLFL